MGSSYRWYIGGVVVVLALVGGGAYWFWHAGQETAFFKKVLAENRITTTVVIDGTTYTVARGEVADGAGAVVSGREALPMMRLAYALTTAERNPLLNLEGTNLAGLRTSLGGIERIRTSVAKGMGSVDKEIGEAAHAALFPVEFLRLAAQTEEARLTFLSERTPQAESAYQKALRDALEKGASSVAAYKKAVDLILSRKQTDTESSYVTINGTITDAGWKEAMQTLANSYGVSLEIFQNRHACVNGDTSLCAPHTELAFSTVREKTFAAEPPSQAQLEGAREIQQLFTDARTTPLPYDETLYELSETACRPTTVTAPPLFMLAPQHLERGAAFPYAAYVTDLLLYPVSEKAEDTAYKTFMQQKGLTSSAVVSTTHYLCPTAGADIATILALKEIRDTSSTSPFSAYVTGEQKEALQSLESSLTASSLVREKDAHEYLKTVLNAYGTGYEFPTPALSTLTRLLAMYEYRTVGLEHLLWNIIAINMRNLYVGLQYPALTQGVFEPQYFFMFQSGYFSLLLGNNRSVVGVHPELLIHTGKEGSETVLYSDLPKSGVTKASAKKDLTFFFSLLEEAVTSLAQPQ